MAVSRGHAQGADDRDWLALIAAAIPQINALLELWNPA